jgi:hypothetical protein
LREGEAAAAAGDIVDEAHTVTVLSADYRRHVYRRH